MKAEKPEDIVIKRITDYAVPIDVMIDGKIYPDAFEEGVNIGLPDVINEFYLGVYTMDDGLIGFYKVHQLGMHLFQGHANIMRGFRAKYAQSATRSAMQWVAKHIEGLETLIAMVPAPFDNVKKHVQALGMKQTGFIPKAFRKNGQMHDIDIFSITKEKILTEKD